MGKPGPMKKIMCKRKTLQFLIALLFTVQFVAPAAAQPQFSRGDCNDDGAHNLVDNIFLLTYLFSMGPTPPCLDACDSNDDDTVNLGDVVKHLGYLFTMGGPPEAPFPMCGVDPTPGSIDCLTTTACGSPDTPFFTSTPPPGASVGLIFFYDVDAEDPQMGGITYSLVSGPPTANLDPSGGILTWFPTGDDVGNVSFVVRATDDMGEFADQPFVVETGYRVNCGEALVPYDDGSHLWTLDTGFQGATSSVFSSADPIAATTADPIYQRLRFATGASTAYQLAVSAGSYRVRLHFAETFYTSANARRFSVNLEGCPVLTNYDIWVAAGGHDRAVVEEFFVEVVDGSLSIELLSTGPDLAILNAVEVLASSTADVAPQITSVPTTSTLTGALYSYQLTVVDPNACDTFALSLLQGPPGMTLSPAGLLEWTPSAANAGSHPISVEVTDSTQLTTAQNWTLQVIPIAAPVIEFLPAPAPTATITVPYTYTVMVNDPGDTHTFSLVQPHPMNASIDPTTGFFSWMPTPADMGLQPITVRVVDSTGLEDIDTFMVEACYRISCAASTDVVDVLGRTWAADFGSSGGLSYLAPGAPAIACSGGDDAIYQTMRVAPGSGTLEYTLTLPLLVACYDVRLHFTELDPLVVPGTRVFDIAMEGGSVLQAFDIAAAAAVDCPSATGGLFGVVIRDFAVTVTDNVLNITLSSVTSDGVLSAIEVCSGCGP